MHSPSYRIGVDLGGTKTEAILLYYSDNVDTLESPNIIERVRRPTPCHSYKGIVENIVSLVEHVSRHVIDGSDTSSIKHVGVCTPGTEYGADRLITNTNTRILQDMPLRRDLQKKLGCTVSIENDANCFALAEATLGAAAQYNTVFGVIMGTGVGGGIVMKRRIYRGRTGMAGEWGHHTLHVDGNSCYCGRRGCVETYLCGPALERRWQELTGSNTKAAEIMKVLRAQKQDGNLANNHDTCMNRSHVSQNTQHACTWLNETLENFGYALANVIDIVDPDAVVLGGGLSNMEIWYDEGARRVREKIFSPLASNIPIIQNKLGDSAGVIGACMI